MFLGKKLMGAGGVTSSGGGGGETVYSIDLSAVSYDSVYLQLDAVGGAGETLVSGVLWNDNGSELMIVGRTTDKVHTYSVSTAYDLSSTVTYLGASRTLATDGLNPRGICFGNNGQKLYINDGSDFIEEYTIAAADAYDVSEAVYQGDSERLDTDDWETSTNGLRISDDGTTLWMIGQSGDSVDEVTLSTAFDVSTGSHTATLSVGIGTPTDLQWNSDGTRLYILDNTSDQIKQFDLSTAYDITTATFTSGNTASIISGNQQGFAFNPTMTKMVVCNAGSERVEQYTCG
jgi:sugar lactone lactonase YvrE